MKEYEIVAKFLNGCAGSARPGGLANLYILNNRFYCQRKRCFYNKYSFWFPSNNFGVKLCFCNELISVLFVIHSLCRSNFFNKTRAWCKMGNYSCFVAMCNCLALFFCCLFCWKLIVKIVLVLFC